MPEKYDPAVCGRTGKLHTVHDLRYRPKLINPGMYCIECDKRVRTVGK